MSPVGKRWLGDGWEPCVVEEEGQFLYSAPVESGFVSRDFTFHISRADLDVLLADGYRRAALEVIGHAVLQRSMGRDADAVSQEQFSALVRMLLHAAPEHVEAAIDRADVEHHMATRLYVDRLVRRRAACG